MQRRRPDSRCWKGCRSIQQSHLCLPRDHASQTTSCWPRGGSIKGGRGGCCDSGRVYSRDAGYWVGKGKELGHWALRGRGGGEKEAWSATDYEKCGIEVGGVETLPPHHSCPVDPRASSSCQRQNWRETKIQRQVKSETGKEGNQSQVPTEMLPVMPTHAQHFDSSTSPFYRHNSEAKRGEKKCPTFDGPGQGD